MDTSDWIALGALAVSGFALWLAWRSYTRVEREEAPDLGIEVIKYEESARHVPAKLFLNLRITNRSRLPDGIEWIVLRQSERESEKAYPGAEFDGRQMGKVEVAFNWSTNPGLEEALKTKIVPALEAKVKTIADPEVKVLTITPAHALGRLPS